MEEARRKMGIGRLRAARMVGIDCPGLLRIEKGRRVPGIEIVMRISRALELDPWCVDEFLPALEKAKAAGLVLKLSGNGHKNEQE